MGGRQGIGITKETHYENIPDNSNHRMLCVGNKLCQHGGL